MPPSRPARRSRRRSLRKDLRVSVGDSAAFSVMVGLGETYLPAFVLALGMGEIAAGLIASIPLLAGAILQLISPTAVAYLKSHRRWVVICSALQASSFIPMVIAAVSGGAPAVVVFSAAALYWGAGLAAGPAWNTWIETVVPLQVRAPFFAWRSRLGQAGVLAGFVGGGLALQYGKNNGQLLTSFACIFSVACICRFISARFLMKQSEHTPSHEQQRSVSIPELFRRIRAGKSERMLLYFLAVQVAVQISGPYFTPYMLGQLKISYFDFMLLLATSFVGKIVFLPACGRFAAQFGARKLLWVGGIGIMPVSGLWLYAQNFTQIMVIQLLAGAVWSAYELAMFLMFFETVRREERTSILTTFNFGNALALVAGALFGGTVLKLVGQCPEAYLLLFAISSCGRAATLIFLKMTPKTSSIASDPDDEPVVAPTVAPVREKEEVCLAVAASAAD